MSQSQPPIRAVIAPVTPLQQNCTIVWCAKTLKAAVIDPGGEVPRLMKALADQGLTLEKIWITHGHMDHAGGAAELKRLTGVPIEGPHKDDQFWIDDIGASSKRWEIWSRPRWANATLTAPSSSPTLSPLSPRRPVRNPRRSSSVTTR